MVHHGPVRPGREATGAAVAVEVVDDRDERVVGRLVREVVELGPGGAAEPPTPPANLATRGAEQNGVELAGASIVARTVGPQAVEPALRIGVWSGLAGSAVGHGHLSERIRHRRAGWSGPEARLWTGRPPARRA